MTRRKLEGQAGPGLGENTGKRDCASQWRARRGWRVWEAAVAVRGEDCGEAIGKEGGARASERSRDLEGKSGRNESTREGSD
jgi:hypothetical protein